MYDEIKIKIKNASAVCIYETSLKFCIHLSTRVSQYVSTFFLKLGKLKYAQKPRNKQIFAHPCNIRERKFNYVRIF